MANAIKVGVIIPDLHYPYNNKQYTKLLKKLVNDLKPNHLIYLGDCFDGYGISKYAKKDGLDEEQGVYDTHKEIIGFKEDIYDPLRELSHKNVEIHWAGGNHDLARTEEMIEKMPERAGLLDVRKLFPDANICSYNDFIHIGNAHFTHGIYHNDAHAKKHVTACEGNIFYGHCFDEETELLTKDGWKKALDVQKSDEVVSMKKDNFQLEWNGINKKVVYSNYKELIEVKSSHCDLLVTKGHGVIDFINKDANYLSMEDLAKKSAFKFKNCGQINQEGIDIDDDVLALITWIIADGSFENSNLVRFHFKKKRKIDALQILLKKINIKYSINISSDGSTRINFNYKHKWIDRLRETNKHIPKEFLFLNKNQAEIFLYNYSITDGCRCKNSVQLCTSKEDDADLLQAILTINNYRTNKNDRSGNGYTLSYSFNRKFNEIRTKDSVTTKPYNGEVSCVSVDNGTLLVRRNGKVCITQNTHTIQEYTKTTLGDKVHSGKSLGCGCDLNPDYLKNRPTGWVLAIGVIYFLPNGDYNEYTIRVINGQFVFNGKLYK